MKPRSFVLSSLMLVALGWGPGTADAGPRPLATSEIDWPAPNHDLGSTRFATQSDLSRANVAKLHVLCSVSLGTTGTFETAPLAIGGIVYATTVDTTYAVDGTTCKLRWKRTYELPAGTGGTNRGAAFLSGVLYRGFVDGHVVAMNETSGAVLWNVDIVPAGSHAYINAAPIAFDGRVFIGTAGGDIGEAGHMVALDAGSGAMLWAAQTVPNVGSTPAASWKGATHIAGGASWTSYTLDTATNLLYVPAGNPGPDFYGADRAGVNLGSESVFVYDAASGKVRGAYQLIPHDVHDWDVGATPTIVRQGTSDPLALVAAKDGYLRAVDLDTGRTQWSTAVTKIQNGAAPIVPGGTHFCPGTSGGSVWNGAAYSKLTGLAYVGSVDWCSTLSLATAPPVYKPGESWIGSSNGYGIHDAESVGHVTAVAAETGKIAWTYRTPSPVLAGVTATGGDLVLTADLGGTFYAFDARSGAVLKTIALKAPVGGGVITYDYDGKQYVAVAAGLRSSAWNTSKSTAPNELVILGL